jgi:hypothetical protein
MSIIIIKGPPGGQPDFLLSLLDGEGAALIFRWVAPTGAPQRPELTKIWDNESDSKIPAWIPKFFSEDEGAGR